MSLREAGKSTCQVAKMMAETRRSIQRLRKKVGEVEQEGELNTELSNIRHREFTPELWRKLAKSMPARLQAVINAEGGPTKY